MNAEASFCRSGDAAATAEEVKARREEDTQNRTVHSWFPAERDGGQRDV